ncbi:MAG: hypothetical protein IJW59_00575 [Clostridia bacterium]|nr:hypothetical protein [Clostridia bacterium]
MKIKTLKEKIILNIDDYYRREYNWLMENVGIDPVYFISAQFRNTNSGKVRLFTRKFYESIETQDEDLEKLLREKLDKLIVEKTQNGEYEFIPFEDAIYDFSFSHSRKKLETYQAKTFFSENEKKSHQMFLKLAIEKEKSKGRL